VPKRIGQLYPETVARLVARPMMWVAIGARPFVRLLSFSTHVVLKLLRVDNEANRAVTEEEITASLEEGVSAGLIEEHEHQMVQNVFLLDDRLLTSLMLPRSEIQWLDANDTLTQAIAKASVTGHSWYPVCRGSLDEVMGVVKLSDLLAQSQADANGSSVQAQRVADCTLPAVFVPESLSGMELLEQFRERSTRILLVVDEYGVVQGMMTPLDMLEAITGELQSGAQVDAWATQRADGSWLLDGAMPVSELKARLDIRQLPGEERGRYNTVAGLLQSVSGRLPAKGEKIESAGWCFEITGLDGKRIDTVLASRTSPEA
ncbi:MAG: hemolysin family protein, partial [Polaromonas sp.]|nr:hemolysin family protein [Polaromonas sp.]